MKKEDSDEDVPLKVLHQKKRLKEEDTSEDEALIKKLAKKQRPSVKKVKQSKVKDEVKEETPIESDSEDYKWWEEDDQDKTQKWTTLQHNGVIFPPEYEPLPKNVKMLYKGKPVDLPPQAEEVAGFYAALLETDHGRNPVFQQNFFTDFCQVIKECNGPSQVKEFSKCDFTPMFNYFEEKKAEKKQLTTAEKKQIKAEKEEFEEPYKFCTLDGRKEQVGNFRIEPPGLFRGRGAHPKTGKLKRRVYPEDVVLNLGKEAPIPEPPRGHKWGEIRHDNEVTWLAMWRENISNSFKYVRFAANSSLKGMSDFKKFEKCRELKNHIDTIRREYRKNLKSKLMQERQIAVATYLIDVFALRAGGEKSEDEADTVGCCSLRFEHVTLKPPQTVVFDFLGKDSIRYYQEVEVDPQVFKNLKLFKKPPKCPGDQLFDRLDPSILNKHLQQHMKGLTAKVFRTYNASKTMQDQLDLISNEGSVAEKMVKYNAANRAVAILCNHQRSVTKGHAASVQKINEKIQELLWQKIRLKKFLLQQDASLKKKRPEFFAEIADLTKEDTAAIHKRVLERERDKYIRKFARDNEKKKAEGEEALPETTLKEWLEKVDELEQQYKRELHGEIEVKNENAEKIETQIEKLEQRIENTSLQLKDKEDNSQVALGTSKINYIDPRLSVVFCKKYGVPIEKIFPKTLREKFKWAIESVDENWRF